VAAGATHVWLSGEDWGSYAGTENDGYVKDIPVAKALGLDVLVAYELDGEPLGAEHGSPLRAVVPGYYGTNWVKWLSRVAVRSERPRGLFTTRLYTTEAGEIRRPVWDLAVNSMLTWPHEGAVVDPVPQELRGWAWGHDPVARVRVSVDDGQSWHEAELEAPRNGWAWQRFRAVSGGRRDLAPRTSSGRAPWMCTEGASRRTCTSTRCTESP
jgi:sulfane dehydrogenase subunit SoxC